MEEKEKSWLQNFQKQFPLPPPDDKFVTGWTLAIEELQDFSLSREIQISPDTATNGMKIYVSVFNTATGLFHGRTWESPLITNYDVPFNQTVHALLCGKENLIVIEFAFQVRYFGNETTETSLFFTVAYPFSASQHICPLFTGSPRYLLQNPQDFVSVLTTRPGQLLVELQQNNDLLRGKQYMPLCTFLTKPPPGIIKLAPLSLENSFPLMITNVTLVADSLFARRVQDSFVSLFSKKYKVPPERLLLKINKYVIYIVGHNGQTRLHDPYKLEIREENRWKFDGHIVIQNFVNDPHFALLFQLVVVVELNSEILHQKEGKQYVGKKQLLEIPIGFSIFIPSTDENVTLKLSQESNKSPFCTRTFNGIPDVPGISFNVSYNPIASNESDINSLPVEFQTIIGADGGTLEPFDPTRAAEVPLLAEEMLDEKNGNHIRILIKLLVPNSDFHEHFPSSIFQQFIFQLNAWSLGTITSKPVFLEEIQEKIFCVNELKSSTDKKGTMLEIDFVLPTRDHIANYFLFMKSNELQITMLDAQTNMIIGYFNIPSSPLLRQRRNSLQFSASTPLISIDGEHLGVMYFVCGNFGTNEGPLRKLEFKLKNQVGNGLIIAEPMTKNDPEFRRMLANSVDLPANLAMKYRDGKRKEIILSEVQKRFMRTRQIYPVPGVESRFTFISGFKPDKDMTLTLSIGDDRVRFIGFTPEQTLLDEIEGRYKPIRNPEMKFIQQPNLTVTDRFSLRHFGSDKISVRPGKVISIDFSYFTPYVIEDKEITVTILDDKDDVCDVFTIQVVNTNPVIHETITKYITKGSAISTKLYSSLQIKDAISGSDLIIVDASEFGVRVTSEVLDKNLKTLIFFFGPDGTLIKITRLVIHITLSEILNVGTKMKLPVKKLVGHTVIARTNNNRVAQFTTHSVPTEVSSPGELTVIAINAGRALITIYNCDKQATVANVIVSVSMDQGQEVQKCIDKISLEIQLNKLEKRIIEYRNKTQNTRKITLTTSHPALVQFDPASYDILPGEIAKFRMLFMPHNTEETVIMHVFIQDRHSSRSPSEYYRFNLHYSK